MSAEFLKSTLFIDLVLVYLAAEALLMTLRHRDRGRNATFSLLANGMAGICLLLAVRAALLDAAAPWFALALSAAFIAHLADLQFRRALLHRE